MLNYRIINCIAFYMNDLTCEIYAIHKKIDTSHEQTEAKIY